MNQKPDFKMGRPAKLKRDLQICKMADEEKMTLSELAKQFSLSPSRISHIIIDHWADYVKSKKENLST